MSNPVANPPTASKNSLPVQIRAVTSVDDQKYETILDRIEQTLLGCISNSKVGISLSAQMVYLQDVRGPSHIVLPIDTAPVILYREGRSYVTNSKLSEKSVDSLSHQLESVVASAESGKILKEDLCADAGSHQQESILPADFVIYVPMSDCHVKIMIAGGRPSSGIDVNRFTYLKEGVPLWYVDLSHGDEYRQVWMSLSEPTLSAQYTRMQGGQTHGVTLLVRDFIRNSICLATALNSKANYREAGKLFFPGVFDLAADVKQHYNEKVGRFVSQEHSEAGGIRKYNNLIKSVLLNHFVSGGSGATRGGPVILDLACGHGQDLMKYKNKFPKWYIGLDISQEALNEARRRHKESNTRYPADFMQGNLMLPETFVEIRRKAQSFGIMDEAPFDVISMQLALHYIVGSEEDARKFFEQIFALLKPGGRFIATFPCCNRIARRLRDLAFVEESDFSELYFGNNTYRVTFTADEISKIVPKLKPILEQKSEESLDKELEDIDFEQVASDLGETWGSAYKFYLVKTIDNQEEYVVPNLALEKLFNEMKVDTEMTANFAEVINYYTEKESPVIRDFKKHNPSLELNPDEDEVFRFYRAIVVRKD